MANYHLTVKMISRTGGKSCVSSLAYRTATQLQDLKTGETFDYTKKGFVNPVNILVPEEAPKWICDIAEECKISRQTAIQKLSNIFEAAEKRKDSQVYREVEFSLPNELTEEQNVKWAEEFIREVCVRKGMVGVTSFHMDIDKITGQEKPHCHALLSTRTLTEEGLSPLKNLEWNREELVHELREQCALYQNKTLKEYGFEAQVSHLSYDDRNIDIEGQPKLGSSILDMAKRGLKLDKLDNFNAVKFRNQFKILKNPELVLSIVTSNHSTFTHHDIAKVLNRYIDDPVQFQVLHDRLLGSKNLVALEVKEGSEQVYTTREMLKVEMGLVKTAERMEAQQTHAVSREVIDEVLNRHNEKLSQYGGLSSDQNKAIRHMLSGEQISCVVGYAGAGKTTSLEVAKAAWEASGYSVIGLAPTGKAARNIEECGIRSMTLHKFLYAQEQGREQISPKTVVVLDEAGMVDSRRFAELLTVVDKAGAKIIPMGDANQLQSVEAGPSFRLLTDRVKPAILETIVRQKEEWQRDATRLFGSQQAHKALALYLKNGAFKMIEEKANPLECIALSGMSPEAGQEGNSRQTVDNYCLARQMSGRIWKEMVADYEKEHGKPFNVQADFKELATHQDYKLYEAWKEARYRAVGEVVGNFELYRTELEARGIDVKAMGQLVDNHFMAERDQQAEVFLKQLDQTLREMSYSHVVDTRQAAKEEMVAAWMRDRAAMPEASHLMLAFTIKDTLGLNEKARGLMREEGVIKGQDFTYTTHRIEKDDFERDVITKEKRTFATGDRILFTSNNIGMGVKNGTLGTILSLDQSKICVALDGKAQREISFAPNLYPYIDNGWATNIHKSQGVTVDHVKKLASFEEYRNLAYVGMTRHRETLEVFGSSLDFWREEKVIDRLSRVQEKLSGFDYVNADKLEALMKEDTKVMWYEQKVQEGKDLWNAIKGTTKSAVDQLLDRPQDSITVNPLNSFEHSEERRSGDLFKATDDKAHQPDTSAITPAVLSNDSISIYERDYSFQEKAILNYLSQELSMERHPWLDNHDIERFTKDSRENPADMLARWQDIAEDYSFKVPGETPAYSLENNIPEDKNHTSQEKYILGYLLQELTAEKHPWLDAQDIERFTKDARENPSQMLKTWQEMTDDYSYDPEKIKYSAYNEQQNLALAMLNKVHNYTSSQQKKEWKELIDHSPKEVIDNCNTILDERKVLMDERLHEAQCEIAARKFTSLCGQLKNMRRSDPKFSHLENDLQKITDSYFADKLFIDKIMSSRNEPAIERINQENYERTKTKTKDHGMSLER